MDRRTRNNNPNEHYLQAKKNVKEWKVSAKSSRCCVVTQYGSSRTRCLEEGEYEDDQDSFEDCKPSMKKTLFVKNTERRGRSRSHGRSSYNRRPRPYISSRHHYWRRRRLDRERRHYHRYDRRRSRVDEVVEMRGRRRDAPSPEKRKASSNKRKATAEVPFAAAKRRQHKYYDNESCDSRQSEYNKGSTNKRVKKSASRAQSSGKIIKVAETFLSGRSSTSSQEIQNKRSQIRMDKFETFFDESDSNNLSETPSLCSTPIYDSETHAETDWLLQRDCLTDELCQRRQTLYEIKNLEKQAKKLKTELALLDEMFSREQKTRRRSKRRLRKMSKKEKKLTPQR